MTDNKPINKGVFIIGVRKCGTTSVYNFLRDHPQLSVSTIKEPQFFCLDKAVVHNSIDVYLELFQQHDCILDGSTLYYQVPDSYKHISLYVDDPYFILCLRDPVKRLYSAYWHMRSKPDGIEKRTFLEIIKNLNKYGLNEYLEEETNQLETAARSGTIDTHYLDASYHRKQIGFNVESKGLDNFVFFRYVSESLYSRKVSFLEAQKNHYILIFEKLLQDPASQLDAILQYLPVDEGSNAYAMGYNTNKTMIYGHEGLGKISTSIYKAMKKLGVQFNDQWKYRIKRMLQRDIPDLHMKDYEYLRDALSSEYEFWFQRYPELEEYWKF